MFSLIVALAILLDLRAQWFFIQKNREIVEICEIDNVYLASLLNEKLQALKIDFCIQGFQYRRLYFFFQPFIKMKLLTSLEVQQEVNHIVSDLGLSIV